MSSQRCCRACGAAGLELVLDLGEMPLVNALPGSANDDVARYPLQLFFCERCTLLQIGETVPPGTLFSDYTYFSSYSDTMVAHAKAIAERLASQQRLDESSRVIELASNDGYLLQHYRALGVQVLGIEPAQNVAAVARVRGIETVSEFFGEDLAQRLVEHKKRANVVHANNVLAHVPDLGGFVRGIASVLKSDGIACIEVPHAVAMVDRVAFDTIYHEHLCYFSVTALRSLFERNGLELFAVEKLTIHGGSLRLFCALPYSRRVTESVAELLEEEAQWGVRDVATYRRFAQRVEALGAHVRSTVAGFKAQGHRVAAYGASAKGCVLMNYAGLKASDVDFVVDKSPHKQGRYVPGTGVPICDPKRLLEEMPQHTLLFVWNIAEEIKRQQAEYLRSGGEFVVPVPEVRESEAA
ncbi:MAG: class I SAM-dependent methyltransferase [Myxococcaceae bacterium]|nr:class I SAM-dependent methyltransferase [Myxococcaceae bacterium]